ncbi:hypothetical protein [Nocardia arizonensis]|uniref:hypothetical protein n=1 Tax=Nocardia arizonensis TaxID=1141647 RepID=UPI0006D0D53A|nr:hypothetical protein [Nocardia arizonensis]
MSAQPPVDPESSRPPRSSDEPATGTAAPEATPHSDPPRIPAASNAPATPLPSRPLVSPTSPLTGPPSGPEAAALGDHDLTSETIQPEEPLPGGASDVDSGATPTPPRGRRALLLIGAVVLVALIAVIAGVIWVMSRGVDQQAPSTDTTTTSVTERPVEPPPVIEAPSWLPSVTIEAPKPAESSKPAEPSKPPPPTQQGCYPFQPNC